MKRLIQSDDSFRFTKDYSDDSFLAKRLKAVSLEDEPKIASGVDPTTFFEGLDAKTASILIMGENRVGKSYLINCLLAMSIDEVYHEDTLPSLPTPYRSSQYSFKDETDAMELTPYSKSTQYRFTEKKPRHRPDAYGNTGFDFEGDDSEPDYEAETAYQFEDDMPRVESVQVDAEFAEGLNWDAENAAQATVADFCVSDLVQIDDDHSFLLPQGFTSSPTPMAVKFTYAPLPQMHVRFVPASPDAPDSLRPLLGRTLHFLGRGTDFHLDRIFIREKLKQVSRFYGPFVDEIIICMPSRLLQRSEITEISGPCPPDLLSEANLVLLVCDERGIGSPMAQLMRSRFPDRLVAEPNTHRLLVLASQERMPQLQSNDLLANSRLEAFRSRIARDLASFLSERYNQDQVLATLRRVALLPIRPLFFASLKANQQVQYQYMQTHALGGVLSATNMPLLGRLLTRERSLLASSAHSLVPRLAEIALEAVARSATDHSDLAGLPVALATRLLPKLLARGLVAPIAQLTPGLESLDLASIPLSEPMLEPLVGLGSLTDLNVSQTGAPLPALSAVLRSNPIRHLGLSGLRSAPPQLAATVPNLTSLDLSMTTLAPETLQAFCSLALVSLIAPNSSLNDAITLPHTLRRLDVRFCSLSGRTLPPSLDSLTAHGLCFLPTSALSHLSVTDAKFDPDQISEICAASPRLRLLDLSLSPNLTLPLLHLPKLKAVNLHGCRCLSDESLAHLLQSAPRLKVLDIAACEAITDQALAPLTLCHDLQILRVASCPRLTDRFLTFLDSLSSLASLDIGHCAQLTGSKLPSSLRQLKAPGCPLLCLPTLPLVHLEELDLRFIPLSDSQLAWLPQCPKLASLKLSGARVTDQLLVALRDNHNLRHLWLADCAALSPASLMDCLPAWHLLSLSLQGWHQFDQPIHEPSLQSLNLSHCQALSDASLLETVRACAGLKSLDVSFSASLTQPALFALCLQPNLKLSLRGAGRPQ